jgi:hypothetical protein
MSGKLDSATALLPGRGPRYPFIRDCKDPRTGMNMMSKRKIAVLAVN